ncbi:MAG: MBL fold metallo-hydrolase, partial [Candidatus Aminicenantales bacterium]
MIRFILTVCVLALGLAGLSAAQPRFEKDVIPTAKGDLEITFLGHASLMMVFDGKTIYVDPYGDVADYSTLPKADLVLLTHEHFDHLDPKALKAILKKDTVVVGSESCAPKLPGGALIMANGDTRSVLGLDIKAIPAYNIVHKRPDGAPFHP